MFAELFVLTFRPKILIFKLYKMYVIENTVSSSGITFLLNYFTKSLWKKKTKRGNKNKKKKPSDSSQYILLATEPKS